MVDDGNRIRAAAPGSRATRGARGPGSGGEHGPGQLGGPDAVVLAGAANPGSRLLPGRPPRAVAGRTGQLVVRDPAAVEPDRDRAPHRRYPARLLPAPAGWVMALRGLRR